ncbi:MAG: tetratricopeptide repeat protein [Bryobacterales bacterium]|nr:tetratricopeptide repeat protein [Bryobacterales bacterium]
MRAALAAIFLAWQLGAESRHTAAGLQHFYNLEYDEAIAEFEKAVADEPLSAETHNNLAQALMFREMYRDGALETELVTGNNAFLRRPKMNAPPEVEKRFFAEVQIAMQLSQREIAKNPRDVEALYALGISHALRANYNYLVRRAWREALQDATAGWKLHVKVSGIDPSNADARLVQGAHDYVVASLPWAYRMLGFLAGFSGNREQGIRTLEEVARNGKRTSVDAQIFLCALYRREGKPRQVLPLIDSLLARFPRNHLLRLEQAQMYGQIGDKANAVASILKVSEMKKAGAPGYSAIPWEKLHYHLGTVHFWYRDYAEALDLMTKVIAGAERVDLNTGAIAWLRTGQIYDLTDRRKQAIEAYRKAIQFAPEADAAKESKRYLSSPYRREKGL